MIDPKTYEKALRAARNVARTSTRAAVGLSLLSTTGGCLDSGTTGGSFDPDAGQDGSVSDVAGDVVSDIVDAVMADLMGDAAEPDATGGEVGQVDAIEPDATEPDAVVVDATEPDAVIVDATDPDTMIVDATEPDTMIVDATDPDATITDVLTEVIEGDVTSTDVASACSCFTPTELACTGWEEYGGECTSDADCEVATWEGSDVACGEKGVCQIAVCDHEGQFGLVCHGGVCQEPEQWGPCCEAAYANEACMGGGVPGCTPWGPPAPSPYDGLTLADFGLA